MFLLVLARPDNAGQNPESCKMIVCVCCVFCIRCENVLCVQNTAVFNVPKTDLSYIIQSLSVLFKSLLRYRLLLNISACCCSLLCIMMT